jgi:hypothetical protein
MTIIIDYRKIGNLMQLYESKWHSSCTYPVFGVAPDGLPSPALA